LRKTESIDVMDAVGSNIRIDARGSEVMRVLPRLNEDVNEEWVSDKTRFACDGLRRQRLDRPYVRRDGKLQAASWDEAFGAIAKAIEGLSGSEIGAIAGDLCDLESMFALKALLDACNSPNRDCRQDGAHIDLTGRAGYLFNTTIAGVEQADAVLIVGANPRWEAPLVNARIRKRWLKGGLAVGLIGEDVDLTYDAEYIGAGPKAFASVVDGKHDFADVLKNAERPMVILGMGALARPDGQAVFDKALSLASTTRLIGTDWNGFNVLHTAAARVGGLDIGFTPIMGGQGTKGILEGAEKGDIKLVWLHGADEVDTSKLDNAFVIYQGHHGDRGAHCADVILPGAAYTEKNATYVNLEGRPQLARMAVFPPGEAKEDWKIIRALSDRLGKSIGFDTLRDLRQAMSQAAPALAHHDEVVPAELSAVIKAASDRKAGKLEDHPFQSP
ncbi:MAG: molybdopterin-dependent oxidoreductase, partial [Pseudomonadota bacterium]